MSAWTVVPHIKYTNNCKVKDFNLFTLEVFWIFKEFYFSFILSKKRTIIVQKSLNKMNYLSWKSKLIVRL